jgi:hypothetical protein
MAVSEMQGGRRAMNIFTGFPSAIGKNVSGYSGRVHPDVAPEGYPLPYAVYSQLYSDSLKTLEGYAGEKSISYQFDFHADTRLAAQTAGEAFVEHIKNFRGLLGEMVVQDVEILNETGSSNFIGSKIRYNASIDVRFVCVKP